MKFKQIKKFLEALPLIWDYAKKIWDVIEECITYENEIELKQIKKES